MTYFSNKFFITYWNLLNFFVRVIVHHTFLLVFNFIGNYTVELK
jgi:hypothetical protein